MKTRLSLLYFLQFAVWGCYLTSLGQFLGAGGLGKEIAWFYAAIGLVSLVTPALMGHIADKYIKPHRILSLCHLTAGTVMMGAWWYATRHPNLEFGIFFPLYLLFLAFYMPTMALANTTSFGILKGRGRMPEDDFPSIRIWGTIGFIGAMWMVNSTYFYQGSFGWTLSDSNPFAPHRFQYNSMQLFCSGIIGIITGLYAMSLPGKFHQLRKTTTEAPKAFAIFNLKVLKGFFIARNGNEGKSVSLSNLGVFLLFVAFIGVCMQISNGFATPFISHFIGIPEYDNSFAAGNATMLFSLSQISEAFFILFVGRFLKRWGIGVVFGIGILAWSLRFILFGMGNPGDGLIFLILSMIIYGVAFNFITIAGHLHMENVAPEGSKGLGQGVMMLMGNGLGATAGIIGAGEIINNWCHWEMVSTTTGAQLRLFMGNWSAPWMIFGLYAFIILIAWRLIYMKSPAFKDNRQLKFN